jgi:hypothetical protein
MKRCWVAGLVVLVHLGASAQTLAQAQAEFSRALGERARQAPGGTAVMGIDQLSFGSTWWPQYQASPARVEGGGGPERSPMPRFLPDWAVAPLVEWVASQSWAPRTVPVPTQGRWPSPGAGESAADAPPPATAFLVAGPAVKDGVAQYRRDGSETVVRLGIDEGQALTWLSTAKTLGWGVQTRLRDTPAPQEYADLHISALFSTPAGVPRVWAVSPGGVIEARLQRLHWGGVGGGCESWIELRWAGTAEPPVWGVLAVANPAWVVGAWVQRVPPKPGENASPRGDLRLTLPAAPSLEPLRLRAQLFEFFSADPDADPDRSGSPPQRKRGEAWGTRVWTEAAISQPYEDWNPPIALSAAGTPRCPVR